MTLMHRRCMGGTTHPYALPGSMEPLGTAWYPYLGDVGYSALFRASTGIGLGGPAQVCPRRSRPHSPRPIRRAPGGCHQHTCMTPCSITCCATGAP